MVLGEFFFAGAVLGLIAGITPGPLLTLVISETVKHNRIEGIKIALAPLISDLPVVLFSFLVLAKMSSYNYILGSISLLGAAFLFYMAYGTIKTKPVQVNIEKTKIHSYKKGILTNILSPHVYLFWLLVGAPIAIKAFRVSLLTSILFVLGFYIFITASKVSIALIADKTKNVLSCTGYIVLIRVLGIVLAIFSLLLLRDGFMFLGMIN